MEKQTKVKKTVLNDDASIYAKRKEESVKKTWKELDGKDKWTFFKDYYLVKCIIGLALAGFLIYIGVVVLGPHKEEALYVTVLMDTLDEDSVANMKNDLSGVIKTDKYHIINIDDNFSFAPGSSTMTGDEKLTTIMYTGVIDTIVLDENYFKQYAYYGFLANLDTYLPDDIKDALSDKLLTANIQLDSDDTSKDNQKSFDEVMDNSTQPSYEDGEPFVVGIDLSGCKKYKDLHGTISNPILAIPCDAPHKENIFAFIRYLFDLPETK
ncbi:MAG TPA: hypothetical protein DCW90_00075 [Lachnospiraceae bacterium]|nr:hypothetical protein [uncultured Lachnoclostridium sp.]HAU83967.1 hypothetical protein [Lachnospiraceae bacterium]